MPANVTPQEALIYVMVTTSAVDRKMSTDELSRIGTIVSQLPMFEDFKRDLVDVSQECGKILSREKGLEEILQSAPKILKGALRETAYMLALEVAAVDLTVGEEEIRFLEMLGDALELDNLTRAALERGARARHQRV